MRECVKACCDKNRRLKGRWGVGGSQAGKGAIAEYADFFHRVFAASPWAVIDGSG